MDATILNTNSKKWENRHHTFVEEIDSMFDLWNGDSNNLLDSYNGMTAVIQAEIVKLIGSKKTARALGGGWTWTKIATTKGGVMYNTKGLNLRFALAPALVDARYIQNPKYLLFAQCGVSIHELNQYLKRRNLALKTSGASNGQTVAGALSTGTHGSAFDFGAIPEFVVGLHIITGPDKEHNIYLERASYPVTRPDFAQRLGAKFIRDDELFNAALVSFGSFGFIHGVLIETEDLSLLECHRTRVLNLTGLYSLMETLDFSNVDFLPHKNERPHHFQVALNPYDMQNGAYVTTMYKRPYSPNYLPPELNNGLGPGDDFAAFIGLATDALPKFVPFVVNQVIKTNYTPFNNQMGTRGEIFGDTELRGKIDSAAIGISLEHVNKVRELMMSVNNASGPFAGVFAFRFVKSSTATLGFTHFKPATCVLELDGVFSKGTEAFYSAAWAKLDAENVPATFHWGKQWDPNGTEAMNIARLQRGYKDRIDRWISSRNRIMHPETLKVFNNEQITKWGLDKIVAQPPAQPVVA